MTAPALRALTYERVSKDKSRVARSPREQLADNLRTLERNGWQHTGDRVDNDRGASRFSVGARPAFTEVCALIEARAFDVLVVWELSRITRDPEVWHSFAELCRDNGVQVCAGGKLYDLEDPDAAFEAGLSNLLAEREVGVTRKRVKRAVEANLEAGRVHGRVQYGYRRLYAPGSTSPIGQEPDLDEDGTGPAAAVRLIFDRILEGVPRRRIAEELNAAGYRIANGEKWTGARVRQQVYNRPGYLGHRVHQGQIVARDCWPALVDATTYEAVQGLLEGRNTGRPSALRYALSGVLLCGECGGLCRVDTTRDSFVCRGRRDATPGERYGCTHRRRELVEAVVDGLVVARLSRPDALAVLAGDSGRQLAEVTATLEGLRARLAKAEAAWEADDLDDVDYGRLKKRLTPQIAELEVAQRAATVTVPRVVVDLASGDVDEVRARWERMTPATRQTVLRALFAELALERSALPAGHRWHDEVGLRFVWRGETTVRRIDRAGLVDKAA